MTTQEMAAGRGREEKLSEGARNGHMVTAGGGEKRTRGKGYERRHVGRVHRCVKRVEVVIG